MRTIFWIGLALDKILDFVGDFFGFIFVFGFCLSSMNTSGVPEHHQEMPSGLPDGLNIIGGRGITPHTVIHHREVQELLINRIRDEHEHGAPDCGAA